VPALINKGLALHGLQRADEAIGCFDAAAHIQPRDPDVWYGRAAVLLAQKNLEGARVALEQARRLRPTAASAAAIPWVRRLEDTPAESPQK
jgi:Flp pilus assembly protein TadD